MSKEQKEHPSLFKPLEWVVEGKIYRSEGAAKLARKVEDVMSDYKESHLMRTPKGSYFVQIPTHLVIKLFNIGTSDTDEMKLSTQEQAFRHYNIFPERLVPTDEVFHDERRHN